jgi:hypothetical protein
VGEIENVCAHTECKQHWLLLRLLRTHARSGRKKARMMRVQGPRARHDAINTTSLSASYPEAACKDMASWLLLLLRKRLMRVRLLSFGSCHCAV